MQILYIIACRRNLLGLVAREIEFYANLLSVSKGGYKERCTMMTDTIEALHENGVWEGTEIDGSELARELTAIFRRIVSKR